MASSRRSLPRPSGIQGPELRWVALLRFFGVNVDSHVDARSFRPEHVALDDGDLSEVDRTDEAGVI